MSVTGIPELKQSYTQLGGLRFWAIMGSVLAWIFLGVWLQMTLDWPDHYGFHCHGRGCWIDDMWHSPVLLQHGHPLEIALFIFFWSMPTLAVGFVIWSRLRKRNHAHDLSVSLSYSRPE